MLHIYEFNFSILSLWKKPHPRKQNFKVLASIDINIICINNLTSNIFLALNNTGRWFTYTTKT